jgi:hypothetical protein
VGDIGVDGALVISYKNKIIQILFFFDKGTGLKLDEVFTQAYGRYTEKPNRSLLNTIGTA